MNISVIIPTFNDQESLDKTLETFACQTLKPYEVIVVDDGSNIPATVPSGVKRIRIERESVYRGSSYAKNLGANYSSGDWLAFSDDDILHFDDALESVAAKVKSLGRDDVLVNVFSITPGSSPDKARVDLVLKNRSVFAEQHLGVISRRFFMDLGGYDDESFKQWGYNNQDLSIRAVRSGGIVTSNVMSLKTGDLLYGIHVRPSIHDSATAKMDFANKYGQPFSLNMLLEGDSVASS